MTGRHLSKRLEAIISMVPRGSAAVDVGCDHAYVPIALVGRGICPVAVASDIRPGPLEIAAAHIREAGLEERIVTALADGVPEDLEALLAGLAGAESGENFCDHRGCVQATLITAGMGGLMMLDILKRAPRFAWCLASPQKDVTAFRRGLAGLHYRIEEEQMIEEEGKFYPLILSAYREEAVEPLGEAEACLGPRLLLERGEAFQHYTKERRKRLHGILEALPPGEETRRKEILKELALLP